MSPVLTSADVGGCAPDAAQMGREKWLTTKLGCQWLVVGRCASPSRYRCVGAPERRGARFGPLSESLRGETNTRRQQPRSDCELLVERGGCCCHGMLASGKQQPSLTGKNGPGPRSLGRLGVTPSQARAAGPGAPATWPARGLRCLAAASPDWGRIGGRGLGECRTRPALRVADHWHMASEASRPAASCSSAPCRPGCCRTVPARPRGTQ